LKKALDREISSREGLEEAKRMLERDNGDLHDQLETERIGRGDADRELRKNLTDLEDSSARLTSVQSTINKLEKSRRRAEADLRESKKKVGEVHKKASRDASTVNRLESELRKLKGRVVEEQDRAAAAESERRRGDVEIEKLKDDSR